MDFFLSDEELALYGDRIVQVPWFGGDHDSTRRYPVVPLDRYLIERGCTSDDARDYCAWIMREPEAALPLVQSWLFFGLIEAALQDSFNSEAHLKVTPDGTVIDTRFLTETSVRWELQLIGSRRSLDFWQESWRKTFSLAEMVLYRLSLTTSDPPGDSPLVGSAERVDHIIRLSTLLLEHLATTAPPRLNTNSALPMLINYPSAGMEDLLKGRLLSQGWCPSTYNMLRSISGSWHLREYACLFEATDQPPMKHDRCSESRCIANNVDPGTAQAKHRDANCNCPNICPSVDEILKATHGDSFPIICLWFLPGSSRLEKYTASQRERVWKKAVVPYQDGMKFVAISHVWSDGLMGTADTGLPQCQIQHLASVVRTAIGEVCNDAQSPIIPYVWIDALCIPLDKRARKLAIQKMRIVYSKAAITVVLDSGLSKSEYTKTGTSISFRMMTCTWSRRLWTLQEAVLSKNVYVLFQDELIPLSSVLNDLETRGGAEPMSEDTVAEQAKLCHLPEEEVREIDKKCRSGVSSSIQAVALRELRSLPALLHDTLQIHKVAQMLSLRDSSRRSDEVLAIAPLLGVKLEGILNYEGEERVKEFWLKLGAVPKDILFQEYPKLSIPGFRCLPETMMKGSKVFLPMQASYGNVAITNKGLCGKYWLYRWPDDCHPGFLNMPPNIVGFIVDRDARQVISFRLAPRETRRDHADINAILLLEQPPIYSPDTPTTPAGLRGLGLWSTGEFHDGSEIFAPGRLLECRGEPPLEVWDVYQGGLQITGKFVTVIIS